MNLFRYHCSFCNSVDIHLIGDGKTADGTYDFIVVECHSCQEVEMRWYERDTQLTTAIHLPRFIVFTVDRKKRT